jgi:hypothetical protein
MKNNLQRKLLRRDLLRLAIAAGATTAADQFASGSGPATAKPVDMNDKRRTRYQADSAEVRDFYRVNSYPGRRSS